MDATIQHGTIDAEQFAALCNLLHTAHCEQADLTAGEAGDIMYFRANPMVCDESRNLARIVLAYLGIRTGIREADELISEVHAAMRNGEGSLPLPFEGSDAGS
jgi:hypothetical protein